MKNTETKKKRYRLINLADWESYATWYNDTDLKDVAYSIFSLWDWDWCFDDETFYWKTDKEVVEKLYSLLLAWERDLLYFVEENSEPFEAEWMYWGDKHWHNFSREDILEYASTRNDLWEYDDDSLVEFVWWYHDKPISEILDDFSWIDWKDDLFDYLNNILFISFDELVQKIQEWINKNKWVYFETSDCSELASEFVDYKELYDLEY